MSASNPRLSSFLRSLTTAFAVAEVQRAVTSFAATGDEPHLHTVPAPQSPHGADELGPLS
jgi:hypothetical protein